MTLSRVIPAARCFAALLLVPALAVAQHSTGYETVKAAPGGLKLTGQDGYYIPAGTVSVDFKAYTYANNTLGVPNNPAGGKQFVAGIGPGQVNGRNTFARAQRDMAYCGEKWTASFDVLVQHRGKLPTGQNLGSFSIQPFPGSKNFIALARWVNTATATAWNADYVYYSAFGTRLIGSVPNAGFQNLAVNKWYRWETDFDFTTNQITEVRLIDLAAGKLVRQTLTTWYLEGGKAGGRKRPTGFRLFAGGSGATAEGNMLAFDNVALRLRSGGTKAVATNYGSGAGRLNPAGSLKVTSPPLIDSTVSLVISNPTGGHSSNAITALFLSGAKTDPGLKVPGFGMSGPAAAGEILIGLSSVAILSGPVPPKLPATISFKIPADCAFVGQTVYGQGVAAGPGPKGPHIGVTEGAALTIGNVK